VLSLLKKLPKNWQERLAKILQINWHLPFLLEYVQFAFFFFFEFLSFSFSWE
jgi:hypothetical protein